MKESFRAQWEGLYHLNPLKQQSIHNSLPHGRVAVVHRTCFEVVAGDGLFQCELTGAMMYGRGEGELPCTGDWVIFLPFDEGRGIIVDMLPRERTLWRRKSGTTSDRQAIAAWVDRAFIEQSLDENFNPRRAERFMAQIVEADIKPVLVLNKADLDLNREEVERQIEHLARRMPVFFTSIRQPETVGALRSAISPGETVVFVGSSGVGKSSLVNALCGEVLLATSEISLSTSKGRHTSTRREMVAMPGGGVLIDTPGVREFGLTESDPEALAEMLEIDRYAAECRFADCTHTDEPGCKVLAAIARGDLPREVYESYLKLRREAWRFSASEHEKRKKMKSFSGQVEVAKNKKDKMRWKTRTTFKSGRR